MATNRDLLKEAIADAKAVKEMAIANAKAALEESFTPQLKSMLSAKLNEMEDLEEDDLPVTEMDYEKEEEAELEEAAKIVADAQKLAESRETEIRIIKESAQRKDIMNELLGPLTGDKKEVMKELLESVQTQKLHAAFDKYLPAVMEGQAPARKALTEAKAITGNKEQAPTFGGEEKTAEIFDIRRLAGLKV